MWWPKSVLGIDVDAICEPDCPAWKRVVYAMWVEFWFGMDVMLVPLETETEREKAAALRGALDHLWRALARERAASVRRVLGRLLGR
jgi:hypothetical protein